jgi:hypothetical protein
MAAVTAACPLAAAFFAWKNASQNQSLDSRTERLRAACIGAALPSIFAAAIAILLLVLVVVGLFVIAP